MSVAFGSTPFTCPSPLSDRQLTLTFRNMAHKSHRQKALQSQLEERPAISLVEPKKPKIKATPAAVASSSSASMDVDDENENENEDEDGDILITEPVASSSTGINASSQGIQSSSSGFAPLPQSAQSSVLKNEFRRVPIPPHRMSPLKREWVNLYTPMVEMLGLQVRMNVKRRCVEMKVSGV